MYIDNCIVKTMLFCQFITQVQFHSNLKTLEYFSAINPLMYLDNFIIFFFYVNLLARYSSPPTRRHGNDIKHVPCYLRGTIDMSLFYLNESKPQLLGYANTSYLSNPHKVISQSSIYDQVMI